MIICGHVTLKMPVRHLRGDAGSATGCVTLLPGREIRTEALDLGGKVSGWYFFFFFPKEKSLIKQCFYFYFHLYIF